MLETRPGMRMIRLVSMLVSALVAAALLAGCAGGGGSDEADDDAPTTTALLTADALPVLVADVLVPAGTDAGAALRDGLLREDTVTRAQFPEDAIVSLELIEGYVAADDIGAGTIITAGMFVAPREAAPADP
jgi:hypothetical protein